LFQEKLISKGILDRETAETIHHEAHEAVALAVERIIHEAAPSPADIERFTYAPSQVDAIYPEDYTGLPN
jgi:2-oxoisovalerate dehydrogenase E1 component alpha subunit